MTCRRPCQNTAPPDDTIYCLLLSAILPLGVCFAVSCAHEFLKRMRSQQCGMVNNPQTGLNTTTTCVDTPETRSYRDGGSSFCIRIFPVVKTIHPTPPEMGLKSPSVDFTLPNGSQHHQKTASQHLTMCLTTSGMGLATLSQSCNALVVGVCGCCSCPKRVAQQSRFPFFYKDKCLCFFF